MTEAMRLLLAAAFADPANQRFQFLDETSIPLYPPHLVWAQFMHETKTRMSACEVNPTSFAKDSRIFREGIWTHVMLSPQAEALTLYLKRFT